jgi:hypothetical protein
MTTLEDVGMFDIRDAPVSERPYVRLRTYGYHRAKRLLFGVVRLQVGRLVDIAFVIGRAQFWVRVKDNADNEPN